MPFDSNLFVAEILKDVSVSDADKAAIAAIAANPVVAKRLEEQTLRQSDYSQKSAELAAKIKAAADYHSTLVRWQQDEKTALDAEKQRIKKQLVDEGIDPTDSTQSTTAVGVSQEELKKLAQEAVAYNNAIVKLGLRHLKEFGEILDTDKLVEVATQEGLNINRAYEVLVQPKKDELNKAELEKQLAAAREEGKAEALKNFNMPTSDTPWQNSMPSALDNLNPKPGEGKEYGAMAAVKAWEEARRKGTPAAW